MTQDVPDTSERIGMTTRVIYYIAVSLDSYIATPDGGIDWLSTVDSYGWDYGYQTFYGSVDALVMGSSTYEQVMSFGDWPYAGKPCRVLSTRELILASPDITVAAQSPSELISEYKSQGIRRIWLVGGSHTASAFREKGLITDYIITVMPVILGDGIPLLRPSDCVERLTLIDVKSFPDGAAQLTYSYGK